MANGQTAEAPPAVDERDASPGAGNERREGETLPVVELVVADDADSKLTAALAAAQGEFPAVNKNKTGEVRKNGELVYTYTYADLGDVLAAVRPVLSRHGLAITQKTQHGDGGKVILTTTLRHVGGGKLRSRVDLGQSPGNPQAFGGALTYLRRYELVTLLGIAAEEDTDAQGVEPERRNGTGQQMPSWAAAASDVRKRAFLDALEPIIGRQRATSIARATIDTFGTFPDVLTGFANGLRTHFDGVQAAGGPEAEAEQAARAAAAAEAKAQDDAAEVPDAPAADPPPPEPEPSPPPAEATEPTREEQLPDDEPQPTAEQLPVEAPGEPEPPTPGSVAHPGRALKGPRAAKEKQMRSLGCICKDPLAAEGDDIKCPIQGHGVPF